MTVYFEKVVLGFSRYNKYTLGTDLRDRSRAVLLAVAKANRKSHRQASLEEALENLEHLKILVQLCKEVHAFKSFNSFEFSIKSIVGVSKQCEGWIRSLNPVGMKPTGAC